MDAQPIADSPDLPDSLAVFRRQYRSTVVGRYYTGCGHLAFVVVGCLSVIGLSIAMLRDVRLTEWLVVPITFLGANIVEYLGHRGPMHKRFAALSLIFHRHAREHHQFFTEDWMTCRSSRDYKIVLFPPVMLLFYLGLIAAPIGFVLSLVESDNCAWLYVATVTFYFLQYESLHFLYHLDDSFWIARLPVIRALREHHRHHHCQALMNRYNFNITWPISDYLFGTIYRGQPADSKTPSTDSRATEPKTPAETALARGRPISVE